MIDKLNANRIFATVFLPFAGGYFLSYLFRNVLSVLGADLRTELSLSNADLGLITSAYFLSFAAAQIPLGIMLDKYGPRRVQTVLLLIAGLGSLVFAISASYWGLFGGRLLIGLGVSGGLMASLKALALWYPKEKLPTMNGLFLAFGGMGAIAATKPIQLGLEFTDWRGIFWIIAGICVAVALAVFFIVPEKQEEATKQSDTPEPKSVVRTILLDRRFWTVVPICLIANGTGMAMLGLWIGPYFRDVSKLNQAGSASALFVTMAVMALTFAFSGTLFSKLHKAGLSWKMWFVGCAAIYSAALALIAISDGAWTYMPWLLVAVGSNLVTVSFAYLTGIFGVAWAARANTLLNLVLFVTAFATQYAFGGVLDFAQTMDFSLQQAYAIGLWILASLQALAIPITLWLFAGVDEAALEDRAA